MKLGDILSGLSPTPAAYLHAARRIEAETSKIARRRGGQHLIGENIPTPKAAFHPHYAQRTDSSRWTVKDGFGGGIEDDSAH